MYFSNFKKLGNNTILCANPTKSFTSCASLTSHLVPHAAPQILLADF